jgi:hypothetical protein
MRKILLVAVFAVAVAMPAPAAAKEIVGLTLCGATGCATEKGGSISGSLHEGPSGPLGGIGAAVSPAKPGPWYRGSVLAGEDGKVYGRIPFYYVPDGKLIVLPGAGAQTTTWQHASRAWRAALERVGGGVKPFPAPTISRVSVDGANPADPQSYLALYTVGEKATTYPRSSDMAQVVLESKRPTPWTDGNSLVVYPKEGLLVRDGQMVSIPERVADRVAAHASLADDGRPFPWLPIVVAAALALLLAAAMVVARHAPARGPEAGTA